MDTPIDEPTFNINVNGGDNQTGKIVKEGDKYVGKTTIDIKGKPGETAYVCVDLNGTKYVNTDPEHNGESKFCYKVRIIDLELGDYKVNETDIGLDPAKLIITGEKYNKEKKTYEKNKPLEIEFNLKHYSGTKEVGLGTKDNPRIKTDVTILDENNREVMKKTLTLNGSLKKGETKPLEKIRVTPRTNKLRICGRISKELAKKKLNVENANDYLCTTIYVGEKIKNYSVRDVILSELGINLGKKYNVRKNIKVLFNITNSSYKEDTLPRSVPVNIYIGGNLVKQRNVNVGPGETKTFKESIDYDFSGYTNKQVPVRIVVNERRNPAEYIGDSYDAYKDNVAETVVYLYKLNGGCKRNSKMTTARDENKNNEVEIDYSVKYEYKYDVQKRTKEFYRDSRGRERSRWTDWENVETGLTGEKSETFKKNVLFDEQINKKRGDGSYFRSKFTYDKAGVPLRDRYENEDGKVNEKGWTKIIQSRVKNGNGVEIRYVYDYEIKTSNGKSLKDQVSEKEAMENATYPLETDIPLPNEYRNKEDGQYRVSVKKYGSKDLTYKEHEALKSLTNLVNTDMDVFVKMPILVGLGNQETCIKLDRYIDTDNQDSGSKLTRHIEYRFPEARSINGKNTVRKVYTRINLEQGGNSFKYEVIPSEVLGLKTNDENNKKLRKNSDIGEFLILANDDLKTHIMK